MKVGLSIAVLGLLMMSATGQAQTQGITYDCDTASSHYSELALPIPAGPVTVTGKLKLNQIASIDKYTPMVRLAIASASQPGDAPTDFAGFQLSAFPAAKLGVKTKDKKAVVQGLQWDETRGGQKIAHDMFGLTDDAPVYEFTLSFDGDAVAAKIGGEEQVMPLKPASPVVRIVCSTGEFLITDLVIARK